MSTFGGDNWAAEARHRKRRVDDLMLSSSSGDALSPSFKKLSNGKYACLLCPHNPILDTPLMLSVHKKGSRHIAAESRARASELSKRDELHKRITLSADPTGFSSSGSSMQQAERSDCNKPLIQKMMKAISETRSNQIENPNVANAGVASKLGTRSGSYPKSPRSADHIRESPRNFSCRSSIHGEKDPLTGASDKIFVDWHSEFHDRREKELKFTAAGWKRDCLGKWYRDENVEFDSDEEDPNVTLG